ncbi:SixA phosphatase family protein [Thiohalorhabdus sp. Cl-TMA]|uniref:Histidine phosphatase family protein n=1 Tax=Thiohalorhabdus methylotrophus TaxID=3242694 RepID=A0ABV4TT81_9GAMM
MKRILLMRHAKSSREEAGLADYDRPLNERGQKVAPRMGGYLRDAGLVPDRILCSSARRTRETLEQLWSEWETLPNVAFEDGLYTATAASLLERLHALSADTGTVLVVGHNPAIQEAAVDLAGGGPPAAYGRMKAKFPTGAVAVLVLEGDSWAGVGRGRADLERFVAPADLEPA